ncbi:hypothetical protein UY3_04175 [Chelonia mydas]|uniref:Uncharacterized protein n=1 Tax=Chelonia mydas TaxID=8469 RepID=M7BMZ7_CHEMY|nr:hypothetical protein UY3_04175 [Chelonia mydas]
MEENEEHSKMGDQRGRSRQIRQKKQRGKEEEKRGERGIKGTLKTTSETVAFPQNAHIATAACKAFGFYGSTTSCGKKDHLAPGGPYDSATKLDQLKWLQVLEAELNILSISSFTHEELPHN